MKLNEKYVLHIPTYKYVNNELIPIDTEDIINDLIRQLNEKGYDSLYMTSSKGFYRSRSFDEVLITIFTQENLNRELPNTIFRKWFNENNCILEQEALAYEHNNALFIEEIAD